MLKDGEKDRRRDLRVDFDTDVYVRAEGLEVRYKGSTRDISLRGVFIKTSDTLAVNTHCDVEITLTGLKEELMLKMEGHVVRATQDGYAIFFESVDLDSYTHLKNIVRYNSPDSELI
jgi:predicted lipid carrier protein YhbT